MRNGHFVSFPPAFNEDLIKNHLQKSITTAKGYLNQERQGIQSTKTTTDDYNAILDNIKKRFKDLKSKVNSSMDSEKLVKEDILADFFPSSDSPNLKTQDVLCTIVQSCNGIAYTDLPGRFPYKSSQSNEYMMVVYHYDSNSINVTPLKNR